MVGIWFLLLRIGVALDRIANCNMEVFVYMSLEARSQKKSVFGRVVTCPDAFDMVAFSNQMKAIFGSCVIEIIIV